MRVTIISNGTTKLVLKPETQSEILAVKDLHDSNLTTQYHESTQILGESYPDCLVIAKEQNSKDKQETMPQSVIIDSRDNSVVATFNPSIVKTVQRISEIIAIEVNFEDWKYEQIDMHTIEIEVEEEKIKFFIHKVNTY